MPIKLNGKTYYWTAEACQTAGTTKNTFLRWVKEHRFPDIERRDRRGWRLFTEDDLERLKAEVNRVHIVGVAERQKSEATLRVINDRENFNLLLETKLEEVRVD